MPRALDPILQAGLENNAGSPIIRVHIVRNDAATFTSNEVLYYKLSNLEVKIKLAPFEFSISPGYAYVQIERGLKISGVEYTVFSSWYIVRTIGITYHETTIEAHLFSLNNVSTPGDVATNTVLDAIIAQTDVAHHTNVISYLANAEWWKTIKFFPTGRVLALDRADHISGLMKQKYLVAMFDIGENKVMPIGATFLAEYPDTAVDHILLYTKCTDFSYDTPQPSGRYFVWRDEAATIHYSGISSKLLHNLGYIESTVTPALASYTNKSLYAVLSPPRLDICNGDLCNVSLPFDYTAVEMISRVFVDEIFDPNSPKKIPKWRMELNAVEWISNTTGGPLPGTIMQVAAYTPLVTTSFNNNLNTTANNLQALADAVDELNLGSKKNSFTPFIYGTTAAGVGTYTTQWGMSSRVGNILFFVINLVWTAHTGAGNMQIGGLPVVNASGNYVPAMVFFSNITLLAVGNKLQCQSVSGQTYILLYEIGSDAATLVPMDAAGTLQLAGFYFV